MVVKMEPVIMEVKTEVKMEPVKMEVKMESEVNLEPLTMEVKMEPHVKIEVKMEPVKTEVKMDGEMGELEEEMAMSYEDLRKHRVEENKKIMMELGLDELAKGLNGRKGEPRKAVKRKNPSEEDQGVARRSSRVAAKPAVTYSEAPVHKGEKGEKVETRHGLQKQYLNDKHRMAAIDAAEEVFKDIKNPAFIKPLLTSHTTGGFWMGLQNFFCKKHLPAEEEKLMLEADGMEWECVYLAYKNGLSGGWRSFSIDNELRDADCCIFELVNKRRFVVHIFRAAKDDDKEAPEAKKGKKQAGKR